MYKEAFPNEAKQTIKEIFEIAKNKMNEGKNVLQKLIDTDESARNTNHLSKEFLEKIQRLTVMNALNMTKITMFGENAKVSINKSTSLNILPAIDVEKKQ